MSGEPRTVDIELDKNPFDLAPPHRSLHPDDSSGVPGSQVMNHKLPSEALLPVFALKSLVPMPPMVERGVDWIGRRDVGDGEGIQPIFFFLASEVGSAHAQ